MKSVNHHKNLEHDTLGLHSDKVMRQRLLLEEYKLLIMQTVGITNTVVDAVSRLDMDFN